MVNKSIGTLFLALWLLGLQYAQADTLRVSHEWLQSHLQDEQLLILDTREETEYLQAHVPGALNLPDSLTYQQKSKGGKIVEPDVMQKLLRELGVDHKKMIVLYDGGKLVNSARVFWVLDVYGISNMRVLSPGYNAWIKNQYPTSTAVPKPTPSQYIATINHESIASKFSTQLAMANPKQVVIDARPTKAYQGKISNAKRSGHIPTALSYPAVNNMKQQDGIKKLREPADLEKIFSDLPKDQKVILYCGDGRAASANFLMLREIGYKVSIYDGSWPEWSNDFSLPIEK